MSATDRIPAELTPIDAERNPTGGTISLSYEYPYVDTMGSSNTVTHEPIGDEAVVQHLGAGVQEITVKGECYLDEANAIDGLTEGGLIHFVSARWNGDAVVDQTETSATGRGGGRRAGVANRLYEYRLDLLAIEGGAPSDSTG